MISQNSPAMHILAAAMGVPPSVGSACGVCGASPFPEGRPSKQVFGLKFVDYDLIDDSRCAQVCAGCAAVLGGSPSKENPPVRMGHFAVVDGVYERPDGARLLQLLREPKGVEVIGWTKTRQRHASLRAGPCTSQALTVGTEDGPMEWTPRDVALLDAVSRLRAAATPDQISTGQYPPHVIQALGVAYKASEAVVKAYRPSIHLDLACALVRRPETTPEDTTMPIADDQREAASLLILLTAASPLRQSDGIAYWAQLVPRRLLAAAQAGETLMGAASRLIDWLNVSPAALDTRAGLRVIEAYTQQDADRVLRLWRDQSRLIVAFARMIAKEQKPTGANQ